MQPNTPSLWRQLVEQLAPYGAELRSTTAVVVPFPIGGVLQQVFLLLERIPPDLDIVRIQSPIGTLPRGDLIDVVTHVGALNIGSLGFTPTYQDGAVVPGEGILTLGANIPLHLLQHSDVQPFAIYLFVLAEGALAVKNRALR